jgi:hypothetical protein
MLAAVLVKQAVKFSIEYYDVRWVRQRVDWGVLFGFIFFSFQKSMIAILY